MEAEFFTARAYSPKAAAKLCGIGMTKLYEEIGAGRLRARKCGNRTLIPAEAINAWLAALPAVETRCAA